MAIDKMNGQDRGVEQIRAELAAFDLSRSECPVDRRRFEKEAERKALAASDAADARLTRIERRLTEIASSAEQRVLILREAVTIAFDDELAARDEEIALLQNQVAQLEAQLQQKTTIDQLVNDAVTRLDVRQFARDEAKRGKTGPQGQRGARGEQGPPGARGPAGKPAPAWATVTAFKNDVEHYKVVGYLSDGQPGPTLDLYPFFLRFLEEVAGGS